LGPSEQIEKDRFNSFIDEFNAKLFIYITRKSLFFIILLLLFAILIPFLVVRYTTPIYKVNSVLIYKKKSEAADLLSNVDIKQESKDATKLNRDIQLMKSDFLLDKCIDSFGLNYSLHRVGFLPFKRFEIYPLEDFEIDVNSRIVNSALYNNPIEIEVNGKTYDLKYKINSKNIVKRNIRFGTIYKSSDLVLKLNNKANKYEDGTYELVFNNSENIKKWLQDNIEIAKDENQGIIDLTIKTNHSGKATHILNTLVSQFLIFDREENQEKLQKSISFIDIQLDTFKQNFWQSENELNQLKQQNNIYSPSDELGSYLSQIQALEIQRQEIEYQLDELRNLKENTSQNISIVQLSKIEKGNNISNLTQKVSQRNMLLLDYKLDHPSIKALNNQIEHTTREVKQFLYQNIKDNELKLQRLRMQVGQIKSKVNDVSDLSSQYTQFEKESSLKEKFIFDLLDKRNQFLVMKSGILSDYVMLQPPKVSPELIAPKSKLLYVLGFISFISISLGLVFIRYTLFDKVISLDAIKKRINSPILGVIPFEAEAEDHSIKNKKSPLTKIVVNNHAKSRIAEAFKKIRASLKYAHASNFKTFATTSTISGEGKTFVLTNLASVYAQLGKRVVIVDLDLRKPRIAKSFKLKNHIGMSTILCSNEDYKQYVQKVEELENIDFITSGPIPPNPSELILSQRFDEILNQLKTDYDYVFIDTPPVGLVNESIEIINKVDIPIYIIRANYSKIDFISNIKTINDQLKNNTLYTIVNHFGSGASSYVNSSYGYGYGYSYGYGYGYGSRKDDTTEGYYIESKNNQNVYFWKKWFDWTL
jgi:capsular exopolysaccharide synthesis family protein